MGIWVRHKVGLFWEKKSEVIGQHKNNCSVFDLKMVLLSWECIKEGQRMHKNSKTCHSTDYETIFCPKKTSKRKKILNLIAIFSLYDKFYRYCNENKFFYNK